MRLKRVFGKVGKGSVGTHRISDTIENARDLRWFLQRYPMEVPDMALLERKAIAHKDSVSLVERILSGGYEPKGFELAEPARDYQKLAASVVLAGGGLLLEDGVGVGKTCSAICVLSDPRTQPAVVVTLTHLVGQWKDELARFAPSLNVHIAKKGRPYDMTPRAMRFDKPQRDYFPDVLILGYSKLAGWAEFLVAVGVKCVIYDEVQELRKGNTAKYFAAAHLSRSVSFRMGLSATAIYNYGSEYFNVADAIFPDQLGTRQEFGTEWCDGATGDDALLADPEAFGSYMRTSGMSLRRTAKDVGRELPGGQIIPQYIDADTDALNKISDTCAELARLILNDGPAAPGAKMRAAEEFSLRLRLATGIAKAPYVAEFVRLLIESGEPVVLFGWHRAVYSIWLDKLKDLKPVLYTGSESVPQKREAKRRFIDGESQCMIISLRAGAGLDGLQHRCRIVCFGELDWSPAVHTQNIGRVLRDGQTQSVLAYYLLSNEGSDPVVSQVCGVKRQQLEGVQHRPGVDDDLEPTKIQTDGGHIRKLAEAYLTKKRVQQHMAAEVRSIQ